MLKKLIARHPELVNTLTAAWQALGADEFALHPVARHPSHADLVVPVADFGYAAVAFNRQSVHPAAGVLLTAQAALLSQILQREGELQEMAAELMRSYDQLVAMYHITQTSRSQLDPEAVLCSLVEQATRLVNAEQGCVGLSDRDAATFRCLTYPVPHTEQESLNSQIWRKLKEHDQVIICNSVEESSALFQQLPAGLRRLIITPIRTGIGLTGFLCLLNKATEFDAGDQKLLMALADEAGALLERDRLYHQLVAQERVRRELEIAAEIQTGLLPHAVPSIAGADLAGASHPANEVGGDFFDFVPSQDGGVSIFLGDVTSKGVPAALFMAVTRIMLRAALPHYVTPQPLLARLNSDLYYDLSRASMFVTLFVAHYDADRRRVTAANAGHSPVLLYQSGQVQLWEADGPPIGVLPDLLSEDQTRSLQPGDVLVAMSDGFSEARNPQGELLGIEPLMETIRAQARQPAATIQAALLDVVDQHTQGYPSDDDRTIIVLKAQ